MITLITGGARSGKSRYALQLAEPYRARTFLATATAFDDEMRKRIADHQEERAGTFQTVEEPHFLARALEDLPADTEVVVVDCLTVWLGNLMYQAEQQQEKQKEHHPDAFPTVPEDCAAVLDFLHKLDSELSFHLILVSNELGMGLVPPEPMARAFRDLAGRVNQEVAGRADRVLLMVSGLALEIPIPGPVR